MATDPIRSAEAKAAWDEYLGERDMLAKRTARLREQRLAAEAEAARAAALAPKSQKRKSRAKPRTKPTTRKTVP